MQAYHIIYYVYRYVYIDIPRYICIYRQYIWDLFLRVPPFGWL